MSAARLLAEAVEAVVADFARTQGAARPAVRIVLSDGQAFFAGALEPLPHPGLVRLVPPLGAAEPARAVVLALGAVTRFEVIADGPPWDGAAPSADT